MSVDTHIIFHSVDTAVFSENSCLAKIFAIKLEFPRCKSWNYILVEIFEFGNDEQWRPEAEDGMFSSHPVKFVLFFRLC